MSDQEAGVQAEPCAHVFVSDHQPGHRIYWVRRCMICNHPDWENIDEQIDELMKARGKMTMNSLNMVSGTAMDGPEEFRGFVTITAESGNDDVMTGQLDPGEVRDLAMQFLEVAEAAEQDRIVMTMLTRDVGLPVEVAINFIAKMREERKADVSPPGPQGGQDDLHPEG
jgi:hypothetical protein